MSEYQDFDDVQDAEVDRLVDQGFTYGQAKERVYGQPIELVQPQSAESTLSADFKLKKIKHSTRSGLGHLGLLAADQTDESIREAGKIELSKAAARLIPQDPELNRHRQEFFNEHRASGTSWDEFIGIPENYTRAVELGLVDTNDTATHSPAEEQPIE